MLNDFLVLGQIPGTKIQITFKQLLFALAFFLLVQIIIKVSPIQKLQHKALNLQIEEGQQLSLL